MGMGEEKSRQEGPHITSTPHTQRRIEGRDITKAFTTRVGVWLGRLGQGRLGLGRLGQAGSGRHHTQNESLVLLGSPSSCFFPSHGFVILFCYFGAAVAGSSGFI